jgi:membrane protein implicated in regulation of membrane protease activity
VNRAVLWLLVGLVVLVLGVLAIAPELLGGAIFGPLAVALGALVPAAVVAALFVSTRRRRRDDAHHDPGA